MARNLNQIIAHGQSLADLTESQQDELAALFENYEPRTQDRDRPLPLDVRMQMAAVRRADAEREVMEVVRVARCAGHWSWERVGAALGTSGEAARQRYRDLVS